MYIPFHNREADRAKIIAFARKYPFATLVTTRDGKITATHLPVLVDERDAEIFLTAHLARANTQWLDFASDVDGTPDALVIFQEPHAFISTRHYERPLSVPTWNYVAVHAYGVPRILARVTERLQVVERMVMQFEGTLERWALLPEDFKHAKANGIVAFELRVTRLDARFKLSQDRSRVEQENIVAALSARPEQIEYEIGARMREKLSTA